jgi:oligogalacturonide lyase
MQNKIRPLTKEAARIARKARVVSVVPLLALSLLLVSATIAFGQANAASDVFQTQTPPKTWIDADTGHRVIRLTDEPDSTALISGRNAFTPDGLDMIYTSPQGIHVLNLATFKTKLIVSGRVNDVIAGTRTRRVFFVKMGQEYVCEIDTRQVTRISVSPIPLMSRFPHFQSVNADESLLVGTSIELRAQDFNDFYSKALREAHEQNEASPANLPDLDDTKEKAKKMRLDAHVPESMFTLNLQTGEVRTILKGTDWVDNVQFSPTDPNLILYENDGPYMDTGVDRIWTIHADGSQKQLIHRRATPDEIATREFWSRDGKTIWYELHKPMPNKPASTDHYLVGYDVGTGKRGYYHLDELEYSVNYDAANDGSLFCGTGHPTKTAHGKAPKDDPITGSGEWIEVLHPILNNGDIGTSTQDANSFRRERLVNMSRYPYDIVEPGVRFSPDNRLVIFTSDVYDTPNLYARSYVLAVEVN